MAADTLSSTSIANLDASPIIKNTSPNGAKYDEQRYMDFVTPTATGIGTVGSIYKMVRIPTNCYLKNVRLIADAALDTNAAPTLAVDVGVYYSDATNDGTPTNLQGTAVSDNAIADAKLFGANLISATSNPTLDVNISSAKWTSLQRSQLLWQALGLSKDPGGRFDIVVTVETGAATGVSAAFTLEASVVME